MLHQETDLGPCGFPVGSAARQSGSPVWFPEEGESRNALKAGAGRSFPGPGCSSQVDGCAGVPILSPGFLWKMTGDHVVIFSSLGILLQRTEASGSRKPLLFLTAVLKKQLENSNLWHGLVLIAPRRVQQRSAGQLCLVLEGSSCLCCICRAWLRVLLPFPLGYCHNKGCLGMEYTALLISLHQLGMENRSVSCWLQADTGETTRSLEQPGPVHGLFTMSEECWAVGPAP